MKKITTNQLRHRVTLQEPQHSPDGAGGFDVVWSDIADLWARVVPLSGTERVEDDQVKAKVKYEVVLRYREGVSAEMRFVFGGEVLGIESVVDVEGRGRWLRCVCESGG